MTQEELKEAERAILLEAGRQKQELYIKYAESQRKFAIGDVIRKHDVTILVKDFSAGVLLGNPYPVYKGVLLKKDLTPKKTTEIGVIHGNESTEKIK